MWFTDPERLFPSVAQRLAPGGVFAFSHREPIAGPRQTEASQPVSIAVNPGASWSARGVPGAGSAT